MTEKNTVPNLGARASDGNRNIHTETVVGTNPAVY